MTHKSNAPARTAMRNRSENRNLPSSYSERHRQDEDTPPSQKPQPVNVWSGFNVAASNKTSPRIKAGETDTHSRIDSSSAPRIGRSGIGWRQMVKLEVLVSFTDQPERPPLRISGRDAWALQELVSAAQRGCTPIDNPAPRWSAYVFNLRRMGFDIQTIHEPHKGPFPGTHARYVLRSKVTMKAVKQEEPA